MGEFHVQCPIPIRAKINKSCLFPGLEEAEVPTRRVRTFRGITAVHFPARARPGKPQMKPRSKPKVWSHNPGGVMEMSRLRGGSLR